MRPRPPHIVRIALCVALTLGGACNKEQGRLDEARFALARGDLAAAEFHLADTTTAAGAALRDEVAGVAARRAGAEERIAQILDQAVERGAQWARENLRELKDGESDPVIVERVDTVQSDLVDRLAEARQRAPRPFAGLPADPAPTPSAAKAGEPASATSSAVRSPIDGLADEFADTLTPVLTEVETHTAARDWVRALAALELALAEAGDEAPVLTRERGRVLALGLDDADALLAATRAVESERGLEAAWAHADAVRARFPAHGPFAPMARDLLELEGRVRILRLASASDGPEPGHGHSPGWPPDNATAVQFDRYAVLRDGAGDLRAAEQALLEAADRTPFGPERDARIARSREARARRALRSALEHAFRDHPESFAPLGVSAADERGMTLAERHVAWADVPLDLLRRAVPARDLPALARAGLLWERLRRGDAAERERVLDEAGRLFAAGELIAGDATAFVSVVRGTTPASGWTWDARDGWVVAEAVAAAEAERESALLSGKLERASRAQRDATLAALEARGAPEVVRRGLERRWAATLETLASGPAIRPLERLAEERRELDLRRAAALELIFDEEQYFYPYTPPACPSDKASEYHAVQRRVDELVGAVRDVWKRARPAALGRPVRDGLEDLAWNRAQQAERGLSFALPEKLPAWLAALPTDVDEIGLGEFAWDAREHDELERARRVRARNERLWVEHKGEGRSDDRVPSTGEKQQVRITNEYRAMFGRSALAWNPMLQTAAQGHSEYMANTGDFGHYENDPERRSPNDRMRLAGYPRGVSENCHMGGGDPAGAHEGWIHSSGHHRNLLMKNHREMASAVASYYWTQNFGADTAFLAELDR